MSKVTGTTRLKRKTNDLFSFDSFYDLIRFYLPLGCSLEEVLKRLILVSLILVKFGKTNSDTSK